MAKRSSQWKIAVAAVGMATVAACTTAPPPAPPPPPPKQAAFSPRPVAPNFAHEGLAVPQTDALGIRKTVNTALTAAQTTWNVRSALNVAALNCNGPQYAPLVDRYGTILKAHARELSAANRTLDSEFRHKYGAGYKNVRDRYMTQVYNYFALPPVLVDFCPVALSVSTELASAPKGSLDAASAMALPKMEAVFLRFFDRFEQYKRDAAAWDAAYLATYGRPYPYAARQQMGGGFNP